MKRFPISIGYTLLTGRLDMFLFPAAFWALGALMVWLLREQDNTPYIAAAFLGWVVPLIAGVLSAYAVLDDPALELHFSTPRPAWLTLLERLGLILAILGLVAVGFQAIMYVLKVDLSYLGSPLARQLAWLTPTLSMMALGCAGAFVMANSGFGALLCGILWITELIMRGWFNIHPVARYFYLFMSGASPDNPFLAANQTFLAGLSTLLLLGAWALLLRQERYL